MSLTQIYAADVFESLFFYKKNKKVITTTFASGESITTNILQLSFNTQRVSFSNLGLGNKNTIVSKLVNIESVIYGPFEERTELQETKRVIYTKDMPASPEPTCDYFSVCQEAADKGQRISVRTASGKEYVGGIAGITRYAVGLFDVDGVEGKVNVFFDWVADIRVV